MSMLQPSEQQKESILIPVPTLPIPEDWVTLYNFFGKYASHPESQSPSDSLVNMPTGILFTMCIWREGGRPRKERLAVNREGVC